MGSTGQQMGVDMSIAGTEPPQQPWRTVRQSAVTARIKGEILRVMTERRLEPGNRLPSERELATLLEASRPSVREALQVMQAEGLVHVRHGAGTFVAEPETRQRLRSSLTSSHDLTQLFDMREILEVPATQWAAERQLPALTGVREAFAAMDDHLRRGDPDWDEMQRLDITFHTRIVQASGNLLLEQTQSVIYDMVLEGMRTTLTVPGRMEQSRRDHDRILGALEAGDPHEAGRAALAHIHGARAAADARREEITRPRDG